MFGKFKVWFSALSSIGKVGVIAGASILTIGVASAAGHLSKTQSPVVPPPTVKSDSIEHKTIMTTEAVAFDTKTVDDPTLAAGTDKTQTEGVNGVRTKTWDVTYTNGKETGRIVVNDGITTAPVTKIIVHGTYVAQALNCPNGTYVNSVGNTVCSPYSAPRVPVGATAQCRDGTYSFSQSRSGTCSHHGGVAVWL